MEEIRCLSCGYECVTSIVREGCHKCGGRLEIISKENGN